MAQRLGALTALPEDLGSIPSTYMVAPNCLRPQSRGNLTWSHIHVGKAPMHLKISKNFQRASTIDLAVSVCCRMTYFNLKSPLKKTIITILSAVRTSRYSEIHWGDWGTRMLTESGANGTGLSLTSLKGLVCNV